MSVITALRNSQALQQSTLLGWVCMSLVMIIFVVFCKGIYNLYFHPLAHVPGPFFARATRLWYIQKLIQGTLSHDMQTVHRNYGTVVRIAPDEVAMLEPEAWKDVYGHRAGKGEIPKDAKFYHNTVSGPHSIIGAPGARHGEIRRLLSYGFSEKALREQESMIQGYCDLLLKRLEGLRVDDSGIDMVKWYNFFTFDVIGDLAFGEAFGCLKGSDYHPWVSIMFSTIKATSFMRSVDYYPFLKAIKKHLVPKSLVTKRQAHEAMTRELGLQRRNNPSDRIDFMSRMTEENGISDREFIASTATLVVAGSETTATLLSGITHQLLMNPPVMKKLVEEIRGSFQSQDEITFIELGKLKYLMACLDEALRVYPPVPASLPRRTAVGEDFYGHWVPADTTVSIYHYAAYHSPEHFYLPDQYIPERWLGDERFANDHKTMMQPFSYGPRNCIGRNLAIMEMRLVLARLLFNYDLELMPGYENWNDQKTWLLWDKGPLKVKLHPAKSC